MARLKIDWTVTQRCRLCGQKMRPQHTVEETLPGTVSHYGKMVCVPCARKVNKSKPPVTVAELAKAGHPCISPAPMPSSKKSSPW